MYAAIRRDAREGLSQRALERKYGVGRRTVLIETGTDSYRLAQTLARAARDHTG